MSKTFHASTLTKSSCNSGTVEITLADANGKTLSFRLTADVAQTLSSLLSDFSGASPSQAAPITKLPTTFAVGGGRYEPLVLVRFEDDVPYGLSARDAADLGRALLEQSEMTALARPALIQ